MQNLILRQDAGANTCVQLGFHLNSVTADLNNNTRVSKTTGDQIMNAGVALILVLGFHEVRRALLLHGIDPPHPGRRHAKNLSLPRPHVLGHHPLDNRLHVQQPGAMMTMRGRIRVRASEVKIRRGQNGIVEENRHNMPRISSHGGLSPGCFFFGITFSLTSVSNFAIITGAFKI